MSFLTLFNTPSPVEESITVLGQLLEKLKEPELWLSLIHI